MKGLLDSALKRRVVFTIALVCLALILLIFAFQNGSPTEAGDKALGQAFLNIEKEAILNITIERSEQTIELHRTGRTWTIKKPIQSPADHEHVLEMLQQIVSTRSLGKVTPEGDEYSIKELERFGLTHPSLRLTLNQDHTFAVGRRSRFDNTIYVQRREDKTIEIVNGALATLSSMTLFNLREKRILPHEPHRIEVLNVLGQNLTEIRREGEGFTVRHIHATGSNEPYEKTMQADKEAVGRLLATLCHARARRFVMERAKPAELKRFGLHPPLLQLEVSLTSGIKETLLFGRSSTKPKHLFATQGEKRVVDLGISSLLQDFSVTAQSLRDRRLLPFDQDTVRRIDLRRSGKLVLSLKRSDADNAQERNWFLHHPQQSRAKNSEVFGLLYRLWRLKGQGEESPRILPPKKPELMIALYGEEDKALGTLAFYPTEAGEFRADNVQNSLSAEIDRAWMEDFPSEPEFYRAELLDSSP